MNIETNLTKVVKDSFIQFSGAVLQSRALVDARDCIKPSARQIFYCMYTDKFIHSKPFQKTLKAIGSSFRLYLHGDSSAEGVIMRAGQPFAYRYPLVEVEGSYGTLLASGSWAAPRYTSARLSPLAEYLFADLNKSVIHEYRDNYDNTEKYPSVLPSKGFYNIVNGSFGLAVGASCSIPQYNIREVNEALIKLLYNPNIDFDEIYCVPDFATGAVLINSVEVKESHRNGNGAACKLRSVVEWSDSERCFIVKEIPYMVYTETICGQLEEIINGEENPGIERFNDLTGEFPNIKIYLSKKANPDKVLKYLYKNTSLQSYYGINFTILEGGRFPKVFTWKQMLQAHLDHEIEVYRNGFIFDLKKIKDRLHIIEGLLKAISIIDEVIALIKGAADTANASRGLQQQFDFTEVQAKAILDIKLARLAHLEISKLEKEKTELEKEKERIEAILQDELLLKKEIEQGLRDVIKKFGDARRTQVLNLTQEGEEEVIEKKQLSISLTNTNSIFVSETSTLYSQAKRGTGTKFKLEKDQYILDNCIAENTDTILFFTDKGNFYHTKLTDITVGTQIYLNTIIPINSNETVMTMVSLYNIDSDVNIIFVTKNGVIKKSLITEYNLKKNIGAAALKLDSNDEIVSILILKGENIGILSNNGNFILLQSKDINPIGRVTRGVKGMGLVEGDSVVSARVVKAETKEFMFITEDGYAKRTAADEFKVTGRGTRGVKVQKDKKMADFIPITDNRDILIVSTNSQIRLKLDEVSTLSRTAQGTKLMKLNNSLVSGISKV